MQISLFDDNSRSNKKSDLDIAKSLKEKPKKRAVAVKSNGILSKIELIRQFVEEHLGKYKDEYLTITDENVLREYVAKCNGQIAVDTETSGLDPLLDEIIGVCLYSPNAQPAYIPLRHKSVITGELLQTQLKPEVVAEILKPLENFDEDVMFNAKFDMRFCKNDLGLYLTCTWDGYLAGRLMNENEPSKGLKALHAKYILEGKEDEFSFGEIFKDIKFEYIPIDIATLYGAHDAVITWELYQFQKQYLYYDPECTFEDRNGMNGVAWCFFNIEMPCIKPIAEMEDNGILLDTDYASELSEKYHVLKEQALNKFYELLEPYQDKIRKFNSAKLDNPINIGSPTQLAILFYDILGYESVERQPARGTGEAVLKSWNTDLTNAILDYRSLDKLIGTYIDKLPVCANPNDGRVHCSFNQYGADTGRMSSSEPNLQNIPSHNKDIRKMFVASPGCVLMSSDYSQQEPSCLAAYCKRMGYDKLYNVRLKGGDLYSAVASACYKRAYEDCVEFNADGTKNAEGKKYRNLAKPVLLGILYGRGDRSVAEGMNITYDEAKQLKKNLFRDYPEIMIFERKSLEMGEDYGFVTTICGRKRRLPDLQLDEYEFKWIDAPKSDDVLDFDGEVNTEVPDSIKDKYWRKLSQARFGQKKKIFEEANKKDGIWIIDNGAKIADATRQCVNARIQGSAADLTKLALIDLYNNKELRDLGFRLLIPVHDEIIAECPEENAKECSRLLAEVMSKAAEKILGLPFKCDVEITHAWYGESILENVN